MRPFRDGGPGAHAPRAVSAPRCHHTGCARRPATRRDRCRAARVCPARPFTSIGGQVRNRIAALTVATGEAAAWDPNADGRVLALAVKGSTVYVGGDLPTSADRRV